MDSSGTARFWVAVASSVDMPACWLWGHRFKSPDWLKNVGGKSTDTFPFPHQQYSQPPSIATELVSGQYERCKGQLPGVQVQKKNDSEGKKF